MKNFLSLTTINMALAVSFAVAQDVTIEEINEINSNPLSVYEVNLPNQRVNQRNKYFSHEYAKIDSKRKNYSFEKIANSKLLGLSLSGGGIRANAFHLGVLSGLANYKYKNHNLLNRVDYISSVSGGSWSNGAYFSIQANDSELFGCLDEVVEDIFSNKCKKYHSLLRTSQGEAIKRNSWEKAILKKHLIDGDVDFLNDTSYLTNKKPYPIINVTHSAVLLENSTEKNFPFEITPDYIGTIVDCLSGEEYCSSKREKSMQVIDDIAPQKGFFISSASGISVFRHRYIKDEDENGFTLSKALHVSSAVVGKLLSMHYHMKYKNNSIKNIKDNYILSDGGKAENLGILALIERGVDLIITSQISADPEVIFLDLDLANSQASKLLKREIDIDKIKNYKSTIPLITKTSYYYKSKKEGDIIFIKPSLNNIGEFFDYLALQKDSSGNLKYKNILNYLQNEKEQKKTLKDKIKEKFNEEYFKEVKNSDEINDENSKYKNKSELKNFPQTPTFKPTYDKELIYAYYLLGKYIAQKYINQEIIKDIN